MFSHNQETPMNDLPRITVIIPSLNQAGYLEQTICSVLDQDYANLELIVQDGGSNDGSMAIIQQYVEEISHWSSKRDRGPADAINKAMKKATGDVIAILHADDLYLPGALDAIARQWRQAVDENPAAAQRFWLCGQALCIGSRDEARGNVNIHAPRTLADYLMLQSGWLCVPGACYSKVMLESVDGFDIQVRYGFEYDLTCRLLVENYSPQVISQIIAARREHEQSHSAQHVCELGMEMIETAHHVAQSLDVQTRYTLRRNTEQRQRIYHKAMAEMTQSPAKQFLWQQLLRRPWWLGRDSYRQSLLQHLPTHAHAIHHKQRAA